MNIGIDARMFGPRTGGGGLGRYVEELIMGLLRHDRKNRYVLFLKKSNFNDCKISANNFEKRIADIGWYGIAEQIYMPRIIDKEKLDLVHFPHWNAPFAIKTPFVATIHDLILLEQPRSAHATTKHPAIYAIKHAAFRMVLKNTIQKSKQIIAVSNCTKNQILSRFPKAEKKTIVIYEGAGAQKSAKYPTEADLGAKGVRKPYFLYIGSAYPHKNLNFLVKAFAKFHKTHHDFQLVLVGKRDLFYDRLQNKLNECGPDNCAVRMFGFAAENELDALYENATAYLFPSLCEGFGLPPLEAMARKVPVLSSNRSCMPEILNSAALYFDPESETDLIAQMNEIVSNENTRNSLIRKGVQRIQNFSWDKMAKETITVYEKAYAKIK
ncbi:MAG: glycosyl transferase, group 1 [uncultured bacterium]|nr:MAG: glycosyl transferase, group 1 [uncultured bacterium]HBD05309.1 hypothetical protein [Candidatus Uhrbacteria bacterium]